MRVLDAASGLLVTVLALQALQQAASSAPQAETRDFAVVAQRYEFIPDRIEVDQGDHVRIAVRSADGTHGFSIRGYGVREEVPRTGEALIVEFDATRAGAFEITCSEYCGRGHSAMRALLVVRPASERGKAR
jgi:cytochrome c oxidase subunit 2